MLFIFRKPLLSVLLIILALLVFGLQNYPDSLEIQWLTNSYFLASVFLLPVISINILYFAILLLLLSVIIFGIIHLFDIPKTYIYLSPVIFFVYSLWYFVTTEKVMIEDALCAIVLCGILYQLSFVIKLHRVATHLFCTGLLFLIIVFLQPLLIWLFIPLFLLFTVIRVFNFLNALAFFGGALTTIIWTFSYFYFFAKTTILEMWFSNILNVQKHEIEEPIYKNNILYFVVTITLFSLLLTNNYLSTKYSGKKETERKSILLMYFLFFAFLCYIPLYFTTGNFPYLFLFPFSLILQFFVSWSTSKFHQILFLVLLLLLPFFCHFALPMIIQQLDHSFLKSHDI